MFGFEITPVSYILKVQAICCFSPVPSCLCPSITEESQLFFCVPYISRFTDLVAVQKCLGKCSYGIPQAWKAEAKKSHQKRI